MPAGSGDYLWSVDGVVIVQIGGTVLNIRPSAERYSFRLMQKTIASGYAGVSLKSMES